MRVSLGSADADRDEIGRIAQSGTNGSGAPPSIEAQVASPPSLPTTAESEPRAIPTVPRAPSRFRPPRRGTPA